MDTKTFLDLVLPEHGFRYLMRFRPKAGHPKGGVSIHEAFADNESLAEALLKADATSGDSVYFATASYRDVRYRTKSFDDGREFTYIVGRTQDNVAYVKSLWMDWDVGKATPDSYATREEALASLNDYLRATGLPVPLVVSSGYGIHTYWVFSEAVTTDAWWDIARYQRVIMRHLKVRFDPARDKDAASVLRAPGTRNKKDPSNPRLVKVVRNLSEILTPGEYRRRLQAAAERLGVEAEASSALPSYLTGGGNLLGMEASYPDSYAERILPHCTQLRDFSESGGATEPLWYACLGLLKHCKDGATKAHEWSSRHAEYDPEATQEKFDHWETGPTTCARFREIHADGCAGCKQTCRSPIQLGYVETTQAPKLDELVVQPASEPTQGTTPEGEDKDEELFWPKGYQYDAATGWIKASVTNAEGVVELVRVASPLFYPTEMVITEDGEYNFNMRVLVRGQFREFLIPVGSVYDAKALSKQLTSNQIYVSHPNATKKYMNEYMLSLLHKKEEARTYAQFGWQRDGESFLLGNTLITANGEQVVRLASGLNVPDFARMPETQGSREQWIETVAELYDRPYAEPYQLAICTAFGGVLSPWLGQGTWHGIPYAMTSRSTGLGKSTCAMIGLSIYARQATDELVVSNSTVRGVALRASAMNHIPFLLDEVTKYLSDPVDLSGVLYDLSNGSSKLASTQDGKQRVRESAWSTCPIVTANLNLNNELTKLDSRAEATQARVFEVWMDDYPLMATMDVTSEEYARTFARHTVLSRELLDGCYGVIGREWITFLLRNRPAVTERLQKTSAALIGKYMTGSPDASKERFYYNWAACVLTGAYYAKKLGFIRFNINHLRDWIVAHIERMRSHAVTLRDTPEDLFFNLMASLTGRMLVTKHFENLDKRSDKVEPLLVPVNRNPVSGRMTLGDEKERPRLYVTVAAVRQWCAENGIAFTYFRTMMMKAGLIRFGTTGCNRSSGTVRVSIGRGVPGYHTLGSPRCFEFDAESGMRAVPVTEETSNVVELKTGS